MVMLSRELGPRRTLNYGNRYSRSLNFARTRLRDVSLRKCLRVKGHSGSSYCRNEPDSSLSTLSLGSSA